jgi:hypothetical protein
MHIKELAVGMDFEVLHGIVDCLCGDKGEPISAFKEAVETEIGILTEVDSYDWITFLHMADRSRSLQPLFWQAGYRQDEDQRCNGQEG